MDSIRQGQALTAPTDPAMDLIHRVFEDTTLSVDNKTQLLELILEQVFKITRAEKAHTKSNTKRVEFTEEESRAPSYYSNSSRDIDFSLLDKKGFNGQVSIKEVELSKSGTSSSASSYIENLKDFKQVTTKEIDYTVPAKKGIHGLRSVRHRVFTLYRRFFTFVTIVNLAVLIGIMVSPRTRRLPYIATAIASNLTASVLFRQEHVINLIFWFATSVPVSAPIWIRRNCAKVYHIGGLHSGFAVASVIWLVVYSVVAAIQKSSVAILTITYILDFLLIMMVTLSYPTFRVKYHDHWEITHRFAGWTALALFWAQMFVQAVETRDRNRKINNNSLLSDLLLRTPCFWLLIVTTWSIILPWTHLRKVSVRSEVLSSHAVRLHFEYTTPFAGSVVRISSRPLLEWHAFATVPRPATNIVPKVTNEFVRTDGKGFSLVVSNAGDWTKRQITHPPTSLYAKGVPTCAVLCIVPLFKSVLLVATGSGIGPCLPFLYQAAVDRKNPQNRKKRHVPIRVFWSTPNPLETFGPEIQHAIMDADPQAVIHDTRTMGRPDMMATSWRMKMESGSEAVCVISNKKLTQLVVYGMEARGVPGYGAIFDS